MKSRIDLEMRAMLKSSEGDYGVKKIVPLLSEGIEDFVLRDGKRIRPVLFLLAYQGYSRIDRLLNKNLVRAAVSLELMHDFLLIHDDVIDNSDTRRGKPSLHNWFNKRLGFAAKNAIGAGLSIVAGDVVFMMAFDALSGVKSKNEYKERALKEFTSAAAMTCAGEFLDVVSGAKPLDAINKNDIYMIYTAKTARYTFSAPLFIGAVLAGADKKQLTKLSETGVKIGQAFQITDDLLDIFSTEKEIGKPILSDLDEAKKTLLVWKAYNELPGKDKTAFLRVFQKKNKTVADKKNLLSTIKGTGAPVYCLKEARGLLSASLTAVSSLKMRQAYKNELAGVVSGISKKLDIVAAKI
ncbi:MAG: polyprenyl synthetase family protein [Candidatus Omnitrophica bacterium]|nr:polyprenyl synthetase family protein [Candidatus Omnitrophota bacterium]